MSKQTKIDFGTFWSNDVPVCDLTLLLHIHRCWSLLLLAQIWNLSLRKNQDNTANSLIFLVNNGGHLQCICHWDHWWKQIHGKRNIINKQRKKTGDTVPFLEIHLTKMQGSPEEVSGWFVLIRSSQSFRWLERNMETFRSKGRKLYWKSVYQNLTMVWSLYDMDVLKRHCSKTKKTIEFIKRNIPKRKTRFRRNTYGDGERTTKDRRKPEPKKLTNQQTNQITSYIT